jgi:DNA-binding NarL/FixJ family response regulator
MVAVAIFSVDQALRRRLEQLPRKDPAITLAGVVDSRAALFGLAERHDLDVVLSAEVPEADHLADWQARRRRPAWIVFAATVDEQTSLEALAAGASAVLPRSADAAEIVAAIRPLAAGFVVLQPPILAALLDKRATAVEPPSEDADGNARLTAREIEVLVAMADGASNKEIARRLDISFHTVKFHVAAILDKLEAESRTEAVVKASQLGIVML